MRWPDDCPVTPYVRRAASAAGHPPGSRGEHTYQLADYGLTPGQVRDRFTDYLATYDATA